MKANLESLIKQVMADILNLSPDSITDDTSVDNTESWDSANHIQLVIALEEEFSISFDPSEFEAMLSYLDVVQMVQSKL